MNEPQETTFQQIPLTQKEALAVIEERLKSLAKQTKDVTSITYLGIAQEMVSKAKIYWK